MFFFFQNGRQCRTDTLVLVSRKPRDEPVMEKSCVSAIPWKSKIC